MSTDGLGTQPSATTYELEDLVAQAWQGRVRVPHFQRDFRWGSQDVVRLFDSIIKGYPIGSLLLWVRHSGAESVTLGELRIAAPEGENTFWVVDGQQRITSIANALHPEGNRHSPFSVHYDLKAQKFVDRPRVMDDYYIPLPILFDLVELIDWFSDSGRGAREYFPVAQRIAKMLRQYKIPAYLVRQDDEEVLTDIFDRMNNFGKRLSRAEIFSALFAGPEEGSAQRLSLSRIAERVDAQTGFGLIDANTVLHSILARRGPDPMRDIRGEFADGDRRVTSDFPGESQESAYAESEAALVRAVAFLQRDAGVPHLSLLTYKALLVVLVRFFAHFPEPTERNRILLRRFYWRAAVGGPTVFKGSFTQMSRILCALVRPGHEETSVQELVKSMDRSVREIPSAVRFRTNEAVGKIILCSWWWLQPRSPLTGERYGQNDLSELLVEQSTAALAVHRLFPRGARDVQQLWAAARLFIPSPTESLESFLEAVTRPSVYLNGQEWADVLTSYCLDENVVSLLDLGQRDDFLRARQEIIENNLDVFLNRMTEWKFEDTAPLDSFDMDELTESGE
ncbi:DUF262 domain-containing protein [Frankia sp. QA3]|uniref:DUF262 domain-containing protein n=1 Tax=Frankia sp. QA3 TaxID=710111 RepID=UPI000269C34E|nr:DUF262 domain-containing protein [Frankia sp. QA3]EIV93271.1 hypothetical protein FraQA3DRAFT_2959 [Frankia sp. QA3]